MNLQQLKVFVLTVQLQKLYLVAEKLGITQPTVTFHLNKLQQELGVALFQSKSYHVLRLSEAGEDLYHYAKHIAVMADEIDVLMDEHRHMRRARLLIGSTHTPATYMLPKYIAELKQHHSQLAIVLEVKPAPFIMEKIKAYELDVGIISETSIEDEELVSVPLTKDDLVVVHLPGHPFAYLSDSEWQPSCLAKYPIVSHEQGSISRQLIDSWCQQHQVKLDIAMEVSGSEALKAAIYQQLGFGILSETSIKGDVQQGKLMIRPIPQWSSERHIFAIRHKKRLVTPAIRMFWERLQRSFINDR